MYLPLGSIMKWNGNSVTEHSRSELSVDVERIETSTRTALGYLRKWVVADKRTWSCSWENLPSKAAKTVDGKWAGEDIELFHQNNPGAFTLTIIDGSLIPQTYTVVFSEFSKVVAKRSPVSDLWNVNVTLEEV